ncbi:MAG: CotH kinase family protein, partial [Clostridia bacterium]|nr:CotH kinase family protein [Clostridia bacterium]
VLTDAISQPVDRVSYDRMEKDTSFRRVEGLRDVWEVSLQPTPGLPNTPEGEAEMDERIRARNRSGLFVSEVMASSLGVDTPYGNTSYDWVEIVNTGGESVNLRGYGLSNTPNRPRKWQFPSYTIQPGEYLLVFCSGLGESPTRSGALHSNFRLSAGGQAVTLSDPSGNVLDRLVVPRLDTGTSYGRGANLQGFYYYDEPTPGDENHTRGLPGYAPQPVISLRGGLYIQPVTVELEAPDGVRIRYTLDGSKPEENVGRDYEGPITITKAQVLRARGFKEGFRPSEVATESFLINVYHILPVVSLTIDPDDLWNPLTGIYADGLDETFERIPFRQATYYRMNKDRAQRERVGNFEYMSPSGEQLLNAVTAVQLHGNFSLDIAQKSFRITAKPKYGVDALRYPFFENRPYDQYRSVILRNGGNDGSYSRIIDSLIHEIVDWTDADLIHQAYQPVIVYLNGQYWGQYDIRERVNKYYAAMYEGWDSPRNIDYIKGDNNVLNGSFSDYRALLEYVRKHDLNNPEALSRVLDWIDVDNYFDFMIFETYFGNTDTMNIKFYRERRDGAKWRWVFFDLDWGYFTRTTNGFNAWLKESGTGDKHGDNTLIRALLKVPEMRDKFLRRYGELYREIFTDTDRIIAQIDRMVSAIEPEMNRHFTRWAGETSPVVAIDPYNARDNAYAYWMGRVNRLKNTVSARPHHVWLQAKDWFKLSDAEMLDYFGPCPEEGENRF